MKISEAVNVEIEKIPNVRQYVQFTKDQANELQRIAKKENRSIAFLVRKAVNTWLTDRANSANEPTDEKSKTLFHLKGTLK